MGKAIGIDLGTTNSVVAFKDTSVRVITTGANNEELCRSCVGVRQGAMTVGNAAYKNWKRYAPNIVVSAKRLMGGAISDEQVQKMKKDREAYPYGITKLSGGNDESVAIVLEGKEYTPEQISAEILRSLKNDAATKLNDEVTHAVITVPAYFNEKQKAATRKAAELAGLKVLRLLAEPTAAAISYGADKLAEGESKVFLVYDFGGGTFDLSILVAADGKFIESGTGGDRWLGGDDIDRLLTKYVYDQVQKQQGVDVAALVNQMTDRKRNEYIGELKTAIEDAKKALSVNDQTTVGLYGFLETEDGDEIDIEVTITRAQFEALIRPLVQRTITLVDELLEKANFPIDTIDNILLVGGSSCIPLVKKMLIEKYGAEKVLSSEKPMLAIAEGAAILAHSLPITVEDAGENVPDAPAAPAPNEAVVYTTKRAVFIELEDKDGNKVKEKIVDSGEVLPLETNKRFVTVSDKQKIVEVRLFSEKEDGSYEKTTSGFFTISEDLPKGSELLFSFTLDLDEIMNIKVRIEASGKNQGVVLGRGKLDSACLDELSSSIDEVMQNSSIRPEQKRDFMAIVQEKIDKINSGHWDEMDTEWTAMKVDISEKKPVVTPRDENAVYEILAQILLGVFGDVLAPSDASQLRSLLDEYESTHNAKVLVSIKAICNNYGLLTDVYLYQILANKATDADVANKANKLYKQMMIDIGNHNIEAVRVAVEVNDEWLHENLKKCGGPIITLPGRGLGSGR